MISDRLLRRSRQEAEYEIPSTARMLVRDGEHVEAGQPLTEGSLNPHRILRIQGRHACQMYLLTEVQKVYRSQGQNINDKHFEVIIRKMISKVQVTRPGDTNYLPGDLVDYLDLKRTNEQLLEQGKRPAKFIEMLLGITKASLEHRILPFGLILPAHHQSAGRCRDRSHRRSALRLERKCDHRQTDPSRDRLCARPVRRSRTDGQP